MTIANVDSRVVSKFEASLTDNPRVVIYDRHMFIVQATGVIPTSKLNCLAQKHMLLEVNVCANLERLSL
jgi:hypothetical protein